MNKKTRIGLIVALSLAGFSTVLSIAGLTVSLVNQVKNEPTLLEIKVKSTLPNNIGSGIIKSTISAISSPYISNEDKVTELKQFFEGKDLTKDNINNIDIVSNYSNQIFTIQLKGKEGYRISNDIASLKIEGIFDISPKETIEQLDIPVDMTAANAIITNLESTDDIKLTTLIKYFEGDDLTLENVSKIIVSSNWNAGVFTIVLTGTEGNDIHAEKSFSNINKELNIIARTDGVSVTNTEAYNYILDLNTGIDAVKLEILKKFFSGSDLSLENIRNIKIVSSYSKDTGIFSIDLSGETGYILDINRTIAGVLDISKISNPKVVGINEAPDIVQKLMNGTNAQKLAELNKFFEGAGVTEANISNIDIVATFVNPNLKITLTPKLNFHMDSMIVDAKAGIDIALTKIDVIAPLTVIKAQEYRDTLTGSSTSVQKTDVLKLFWSGVTEDNILNMTIESSVQTGPNNFNIILSPKDGFAITGALDIETFKVGIIVISIKTDLPLFDGKGAIRVKEILENANTTNEKKYTVLSNFYEGGGLSIDNMSNITTTVEYNPITGVFTMKVIGKPGFVTSTEAEVTINGILIISAKAGPFTLSAVDRDILITKLGDSNASINLDALDTYFEGGSLVIGNIPNINIAHTWNSTTSQFTITLTGKDGFMLPSETKIDISITESVLDITAKTSVADISSVDAAAMKTTLDGSDDAAKLIELAKLFEGRGLTEANIPNMTITTTIDAPSSSIKVALSTKAGTGYTITIENTATTLVPLAITAKTSVADISSVEAASIKTILDDPSASNANKLTELNKFFQGVSLIEANIPNMTITTTLPSDTSIKVALSTKAGTGYWVDVENTATTTLVPLAIIAKTSVADISSVDAAAMKTTLDGSDDAAKLIELQKLFEGTLDLTLANIPNMTITTTIDASSSSIKVALSTKAGTGYRVDVENTATTFIALDITAKSSVVDISSVDAASIKTILDDPSASNANKLTELNKFFEGASLTEANIPNMTITTTLPSDTSITVALSTKAGTGYRVDVENTATTTLVPLAITAKTLVADISSVDAAAMKTTLDGSDDAAKLIELQKLFEGTLDLTLANIPNMTITTTITPSASITVVLSNKAGTGYTVNATSSANLLTDIAITVTTPLPTYDTNVAKALHAVLVPGTSPADLSTALSPYFGGVTSANIVNVNITSTHDVAGGTHIVELTAKDGYFLPSDIKIEATVTKVILDWGTAGWDFSVSQSGFTSITDAFASEDPVRMLEILENFFFWNVPADGETLTIEDMAYITATISQEGSAVGDVVTMTITVKDGYIFSLDATTLSYAGTMDGAL